MGVGFANQQVFAPIGTSAILPAEAEDRRRIRRFGPVTPVKLKRRHQFTRFDVINSHVRGFLSAGKPLMEPDPVGRAEEPLRLRDIWDIADQHLAPWRQQSERAIQEIEEICFHKDVMKDAVTNNDVHAGPIIFNQRFTLVGIPAGKSFYERGFRQMLQHFRGVDQNQFVSLPIFSP